MKNVLVTGSAGFIGRNLVEALKRKKEVAVLASDVDTAPAEVERFLAKADVIYHLAGVNRPQNPAEYEIGNAGATRDLITRLNALRRIPLVVFSSSTQAALNNPYGLSKLGAEQALEIWASRTGAAVALFRLPNVFGKWCRPNYNSAVATFCHNITRGLSVNISDRTYELEIVYVDDVVQAFIDLLDLSHKAGAKFHDVSPTFNVTLGEIVDLLTSFKSSRKDLVMPDFSRPLVKRLYATYLSYMPEDGFGYALDMKEDHRGALAELFKATTFGQIFVSRTKPGATRGNHYHDTKTEKFCVLEGDAVFRFRHIEGEELITYRISGRDFRVMDIPPGYTHSIENVGDTDMVVLFWASEPFDPQKPDTHPLEVIHEKA